MSIPSVDPRVFKRFKIVVCPYCRRMQAVMATKRFRCKFCGKSMDMSKLRIYYATDDARGVPYVMRVLQEKMARGELR